MTINAYITLITYIHVSLIDLKDIFREHEYLIGICMLGTYAYSRNLSIEENEKKWLN